MDPIIHFLGSWSDTLGAASILLRLALSCCYAGIIGCEGRNFFYDFKAERTKR